LSARVKEVIRRRGENVAPVEIEEALADHPDVFEVAVVGVPSELSEEEIKAFLLTAPDADLAAIVDGHRAGESGPVVGRLVRRSVAPSNSSRVTPPGSPF